MKKLKQTNKKIMALLVIPLLVISFLVYSNVFAVGGATVTPAVNGGSISIDDTSAGGTGSYTTLDGPVITEGAVGNIATGIHTLTLPAGWEFNPTQNVTVGIGGATELTLSSQILVPSATTISFNVATASSTGVGVLNFSDMEIRPTNTSIGSGNITMTVGTIDNVNGSTNFGTLTTVVGTATKNLVETANDGSGSVVTTQSITSGGGLTVYNIRRDQFDHFVSNSSATWTLESKTGGIVDGDLVDGGASAVFTANATGTAVIRATDGVLTGTDSGTITVAAGPAGTPTAAAGPYINDAEETATFTITAPLGSSGAAIGDTLELLLGSASFPTPLTRVLDATDISNTYYIFTIDSGQLGADAVKSITTKITSGGVDSAESASLSLTLDTVDPTAVITYSKDAGNSYASTEMVRDAHSLVIKAVFNEDIADAPVMEVEVDNAVLASIAMTKTSATEYTYTLDVPAGDVAVATVTLSTGTDLAGNPITVIPTGGTTFEIDNTVPTFTVNDDVAGTLVQTDTINVTITEANIIVSAQYGYDNGGGVCDNTDVYATTFASGVNFDIVDDHTQDLCLKVVDLAGNMGFENVGTLNTDNTNPTIQTTTLTSPNSSSELLSGSSIVISWVNGDIADDNLLASPITVDYYNGTSWAQLATGELNDGSYTWIVPAVDISNAKIKITAIDGAGNTSSDESDFFIIDNTAPVVNVTNSVEGGPVSSDTINATITEANTVIQSMYGFSTDATCNSGDTWGTTFTSGADFVISTDHTDYLCLKVSDKSGHITYTLVGQLNVDNTAPTMEVDTLTAPNGAEEWQGGSVQNITWTQGDITDAGGNLEANPITLEYFNGTIWVQIATGEANDSLYAWTVPSLDIATAKVRIIAADTAGNTSNDESDATFIIDSTGPTVVLSDNDAGVTVNDADSAIVITATFTDTNDIAATPQITIGGFVGPTGMTSTGDNKVWTYTWDVPAGNDGSHTVTITATDIFGNSNAVATGETSYIIDNTAPTFTVNTNVDVGPVQTDTIKVTITETNSVTASEYGYDEGSAVCDSGDTYGNNFTTAVDFDIAGDHTEVLCVMATDEAGNIGYHAVGTLNTDNTVPAIAGTALTSPNGGEFLAGGSVQNITWIQAQITDTNSLGATPITLEYYDGSGWNTLATGEANDSTYSWNTVPSLDISTAKVRITATDTAGNSNSIESDATFTIDSTQPTVVLTDDSPSLYVNDADTVIIAATFTDTNAVSGTPTITIGTALATTPMTEVNNKRWTYTWNVPAGNDGSHIVTIAGTDAAGNTNIAATGETPYIVDNTAPTFTINSGVDVGPTQTDVINVSITEVGGLNYAGYMYSDDNTCDSNDAFVSYVSDNTDFSIVGDHTDYLCVSGNDMAGNIGYQLIGTLNTDNTVPNITASTLTSPNGGESWAGGSSEDITWASGEISDSNELGATPITLQYYDGSGWVQIATGEANDGTYTWNPVQSLNIATAKVKIIATDTAGNTTNDESDADFTIDSIQPTVVLSDDHADSIVNDSDTVVITATFTDTNNITASPTVTIGALIVGASMTATGDNSVWTYSWNVPSGNDGAHAVSITATDLAGNSNTAAGGQTSYTIDNTAATLSTVTIASDNADTTLAKISDTITLTFVSDTDLGATPVVTIDGNNADAVTQGIDLSHWTATRAMQTGDSAGAITFTIDFVDISGNNGVTVTATTDASSVTFDETAPSGYTVAFDQPDVNSNNDTAISFTFAAAEVGTTYNYSIDDVGNMGTAAITGTATITSAIENIAGIDLSTLDDSVLTLTVYLTDPTGNQGSNTTDTVTKDSTAPVVANESPTNGSTTSDTRPAISADFSDNLAGIDTTTATISINGTDVTAFSVVTVNDITYTPSSSLSDGMYTMVVDVDDLYGNSATQSTWTFQVSSATTTITVTTDRSSVYADGTSQATISAQVLANGVAVTSGNVNFATTIGTLSAAVAALDGSGRATVTLTSSATGQTTVTATYDAGGEIKQGTVNVTFIETPKTITSIASDSPVDADNVSTSTITATLLDNGSAMVGETIMFSSDLGTLSSATAVTNGSGEASITIKSSADGTATITSSYNTGSETLSDASTVVFTLVDTIAPTATFSPVDNEVDIATSVQPYIDFNEAMDEATLTTANIKIKEYVSGDEVSSTFVITTNNDDSTRVTIDPDSNLSNNTQYYFIVSAGVTDSAGNSITAIVDGDKASYEFTTVALVTSYTIDLNIDWNLVSLPLIPNDSDIAIVLSGIVGDINNIALVKYFDANTETWLSYVPSAGVGTLSTMEDGKGYWVSMTSADSLVINGTQMTAGGGTPPTYQVYGQKWNLIGFKSVKNMVASSYVSAIGANDTMRKYDNDQYELVHSDTVDNNMQMTYGYWLYPYASAGYEINPSE